MVKRRDFVGRFIWGSELGAETRLNGSLLSATLAREDFRDFGCVIIGGGGEIPVAGDHRAWQIAEGVFDKTSKISVYFPQRCMYTLDYGCMQTRPRA